MPRILKSQIKRNRLTAYPETRQGQIVSVPGPQVMVSELFKKPPKNDLYRTRYGRSLTLDRIQAALLAAQDGQMRDLTDMSRETIGLDPHLTSVLYKRFNSVASLPWECRPAEGPGVDPKKAQAYADFVREQLLMANNFRQSLVQLAWGLFDGRAALETHWVDRPEKYTPKSVEGMTLDIRWRVGSLGWIHPRRLCFDDNRDLYINDTGTGSGFDKVGVPLKALPFKFVSFTPQLFGDYPELEGLAPKCMYWSFFKRFGARERMVLLELFGKPWRIVKVAEDSEAGSDDLIEAEAIVDQLGNTTTARLPRGVDLDLEAPDPKAGELHKEIIEQSDKQISKLVLGQTGTTDAQPGALGGGIQSLVMSNEQFIILSGDAAMLGEAIENYLTDAIIELNFGAAELINAPRFVLRAETNPDKKVEAERMKLALDMGLPIELDEAYEVLGFKKPEPGSIVIQMQDKAGPMGSVRAPVITITPEEIASVGQAIDDAAASVTDPDEEVPPDPAAVLVPPENQQVEPPDDPATKAQDAIKDVLGLEQVSAEFERILLSTLLMGEHEQHHDHVTLSKNRQPDSVHGTIETLIEKGVREGARVTQRWGDLLVSSVKGATTGAQINRALTKAAERLDVLQFARTIERRMTHASMTGSLDSQWEDETDNQIAPEKFAARRAALADIKDVSPDFTSMAYKNALQFFKSKSPVPKSVFEKLSAAAKARSFTVAGLASEHLLNVAQSELTNAIVEGTKLTDFASRLAKRFVDAGTTPLNASHVETIFRTNLVTSYNVGRKAEMTQPDALKARPYWQIRTVRDDRQRQSHGAVDGWVLRATDPFWRNVGGPPWGFNCRCRTTTIRAEKLGDRTVRSGAEIRGLPDDGFDAVPL